jgi:hypothetical protein
MTERAGRRWMFPLAAALLTLVGSIRIVSTYWIFNHTIDEPPHLAAGMEWLDAGRYTLEAQHPPLARVAGALGPYLAGERLHGASDAWFEGFAILGRDEHYDRTLALGRLGILPFFWLGALVVYVWARREGGPMAALIATLLYTTLPPVLAHAGLITTDMALATLTAAAALASLWWAEKPTLIRSIVFGVALAAAVLAKFSALAFLPAAWSLMYVWHLFRDRPGLKEVGRRALPAVLVSLIAAVLVWAGYRFTFGPVGFLGVSLPAPALLEGLRVVWEHNQTGHLAYLLGRRSMTGFWYYYPVVLGVKTPLGMLLLLFWTVWIAIRHRDRRSVVMPLAFSVGILLFAAWSRINIGVRHVLPVYFGFSVACGIAAASVIRRTRAGIVLCALLGWHVVSGAILHPEYLAYTNELAGWHPENILADSDLDWGQDMKRLGEYLKRAGTTKVTMALLNRGYPVAGHDFPVILPMNPARPSAGWNAISITMWKVGRFDAGDGPVWPDRLTPKIRIGRSMLVAYSRPRRILPTGSR